MHPFPGYAICKINGVDKTERGFSLDPMFLQ